MKKNLFTILLLCCMTLGAFAQQYLLQEGFEGTELPTGWTLIDNDGDGNNWYVLNNSQSSSGGFVVHSGQGHITSASYASVALTPDNWLITPAVTLNSAAVLSFWVAGQDQAWAAEHFSVYLSTTGTTVADFTTTLLYDQVATGVMTQYTVYLTQYTGQTVYIAFRHHNISDMFRLNLDDVEITEAPSSATIEATPTSIDFYTAIGTPVSSTVNVNAINLTGAITATTAAPYLVSADSTNFGTTATLGTTGGTLYVQYNPTVVGTDSGTITLSSTGATNVDIALNGRSIVMGSLPYTQDFEDNDENASWCFYHNGVNQWNIGTALNTTDGGSNALYISNDNGLTNYYDVNSASTSWAYRDIDFGTFQEYTMTFNVKNMGESTSYDYLKIYLGPPAQVQNTASSTGSTLQGATLVGSWANLDTWAPVSVNIPSSFTGIQRLYLLWWNDASSGTNPPAAIDDITITGSNCSSPTQFVVTGNTSTTVSLSWQGNDNASNYNIAYGPTGFTIDETDLETVQDTSITLTDLTSGQTYDFYVRTDCGTEVSGWRGPVTATPGSINIGTTGSSSITACSTVIYDDGGMYGSYSNNCNYTLTIYPDDPGSLVSVSGTFAGEGTIDYLSIYNGTTTNADSLIQKVTSGSSGTTVNFGPLTSEVGPLTLKFYSDGSVVYDGFVVNVSCVAAPECSPAEDLTISNISGTSALVSWGTGHFGTISSFTVEYTEAGQENWTTAASGITETSYLLSGLDPVTAYDVRVTVTCEEDESTGVIESFTTHCLAGGEIAIGNGTSTSYVLPLNNFYNYTYTEQIFLASELNGTGTLTSVSFDYNYATAMSSKTNVDIYLKHTTQSAFSSTTDYIDTVGAQLVYHGTLNCQQGWNTFNFTAPFQYNGTDNLVLIVDDNSGSYNGSSYNFNVHDAGATRSLYYYSDSYNPEPGNLASYSGSKYTTANRNNVIFGGNCDETVTCIAPNMLVDNITSTSADVIWVSGYDENNWEMEYTLYGDSVWTPVSIASGSPVTIDQLSVNTLYTVRMRSVCAPGDESNWVYADFRTDCGAITTLPYSDNFDTYGTGTTVYPECWGKINTYTSADRPYIISTNYSAPGSMYFYTSTNGTYNIAITPEFDASIDISTLQASFMYRATNSTDMLIVGVIDNPANASTFVPVDTVYPSTSSASDWVEKIVNFDQYVGNGQYIAFKNAYTTATAYAYIDNLVIDEIPSCPKPTDLTAASGASDSVTLSWSDPYGNTWDIIYGSAGFNPETSTDATLVSGVTDNPYIISGLTGGTIYEFYVRSDCGGGDVSPWCSIPASAAPFTIQMGISGSSTITGCDFTVTDDGGVNGNYSNNCNYTLTIYPGDQNSLVSISGTFAGESSLDYLSVFEGTTTSDANLILKIYSSMNSGSSGSVVNFGPLTSDAGPMTLLFHSDGSVVYPGFVATVTCVPAPTCRKPINLAVSNISQNSVSLSWTAMGGENDWDIIYGTPGFNPESAGTLVQNVGSNPYTLTGLTALTAYEVYVRANCGGGDVSDWVATSVTFNTAGCDVADQCQYVLNCEDSFGDGWNGASIAVQQNGITIATVTISDGYSNIANITLCDNISTALVWTSGSYDSECSFTLLDPTGATLYTSSSLSSGSLFTFTTNCNGSTPPPTCNVPTNLNATATAYNTADVTWTAGGSETAWNLQYKAASAANWSANIPVTTTNYQLTGLTAQTAYQVRVQANCGNDGTSDWATANFTTPAEPVNPCNVPTNLQVSNITENTATVAWTAGGSETAWNVQYKLQSASQWQEANVNTTSYAIEGLTANSTYDVRVKAICAADNQSDFVSTSFTTDGVGIDNITLANSINLMPNPADNYIDLTINSSVDVKKAVVYNAFGQMIQTIELTDNHARIDLSDMAAGMYFVRVNGDNVSATKKFIKR